MQKNVWATSELRQMNEYKETFKGLKKEKLINCTNDDNIITQIIYDVTTVKKTSEITSEQLLE